MQWTYIVFVLLLDTVWCQNEVAEDLQDFGIKLNELSSFENFNQSALPSVEDVQDALRQKCEKNDGASAFEKLGGAKDDLYECIQSNLNFTQIQEELNKSRKNGSMDEVFAKHCRKTSVVQECITKVAIAVEPCFDEEEKSSLKLLLNITDSLANFACYKDGDRIAMFVADGGFECIQSKKESLEECANKTLSHHVLPDWSLNNLPSLVISEEICNDYANLQSCVVSVLETCEDDTPANIVNALFKYVRRMTPCKNHLTTALGAQWRVLRSSNNQQGLNALSDVFSQVKQKYEPHCLKNGGQIAADKFRETLDQVKNCSNVIHSNFMEKVKELKRIPFEYLCRDFRFGIRGCLSTLSIKMEACSSPQEAYVPKFGIDLYDSLFNFYCKDDARTLRKFLGERDACMNKMHSSTRFCLNKTKHIEVYAKQDVVTKTELCSDLKTLRNCFLDIAAQHCSNNANTNEIVVGLSDAMYEPCSGCKILVPNFLLLLWFMFKFVLKIK